MPLTLILVALLVVALGLIWWQADQRRGAGVDPVALNRGARNHRDMARLLERIVRDDMLRPMLPASDRDEARRLLREYLGDDQPELP